MSLTNFSALQFSTDLLTACKTLPQLGGICSGELEQLCTLPSNNTTFSCPYSLARKSSSYHVYVKEKTQPETCLFLKKTKHHHQTKPKSAQNRNYITLVSLIMCPAHVPELLGYTKLNPPALALHPESHQVLFWRC